MISIAILRDLRFQDVLDILFLSAFSYHLYIWFRGTKAFKALVGLLVFGLVFTAARVWGMFLTTWVFQILWQVVVILLIILFQKEIRQVLERVNPLHSIGVHRTGTHVEWAQKLAQAVYHLASRKIGALLVMERSDLVEEHVTEGQPLEAEPTQEVLLSIFQKDSPLHDGAAILRKGRISQVSCYLPLTSETGLPQEWGTRHRAAKGLTERSDAWIVVVSEERGDVSLAREGGMEKVEGPERLSNLLEGAYKPSGEGTWVQKAKLLVTRRWRIKGAVFVLIFVVWMALAGQQDYEVAVSVPLKVRDIPTRIELLDPPTQRILIRVQGLRKHAGILNENNVEAVLDASAADAGREIFRLSRSNILLPNEELRIIKIEPAFVELTFKETAGNPHLERN